MILLSSCNNGQNSSVIITLPVPDREAGQTDVLLLKHDPIDTVKVAFVGLGMRGSDAVRRFIHIPGIKITALCDIDSSRVNKSNKLLIDNGFPEAKSYYGNENIWEELVKQPDIDLVYICTSWDSHTKIAVTAMKSGKHAAIEVPAAMSVQECWDLVNTAEQTRMHCIMLENCTYDRFETTTLNMVQQGLFGEIVHVEGAYIHDLRFLNFEEDPNKGYWNMWRLKYNAERKGDIYPTHGLGPVAQVLNIHRGDKMKYLVSMGTNQFGMTEYAKEKFGENSDYAKMDYKMSDHTSTSILTEMGKTILIQHDVTSPRPYNRIHQISGTKGFAQKYPYSGIALEGGINIEDYENSNYQDLSGHSYVPKEIYDYLMSKYKHPFYVEMEDIASKVGGHGGMDFIMDWRLVYCLRNGLHLDMDVYDAAEWSCLTELSQLSIDNNSAPVAIPDFTRGAWNKLDGLKFAY
jgi:predicted dehydrogenase